MLVLEVTEMAEEAVTVVTVVETYLHGGDGGLRAVLALELHMRHARLQRPVEPARAQHVAQVDAAPLGVRDGAAAPRVARGAFDFVQAAAPVAAALPRRRRGVGRRRPRWRGGGARRQGEGGGRQRTCSVATTSALGSALSSASEYSLLRTPSPSTCSVYACGSSRGTGWWLRTKKSALGVSQLS